MQQIVLSRVEWLKICKLSSKVSDYMECTTEESQRVEEQSWVLTQNSRCVVQFSFHLSHLTDNTSPFTHIPTFLTCSVDARSNIVMSP